MCDSEGEVIPLAGVRVELWDSDCLGSSVCDDRMGTGYTDENGYFDVTGDGGDPLGGRPDPYVRALYNDDEGVRVIDEINRSRQKDSSHHSHDNSAGLVDFGTLTAGKGTDKDDSSDCGLFLAARSAFGDYVDVAGEPPPAGHFKVYRWTAIWKQTPGVTHTPWTNRDIVHWPIGFGTSINGWGIMTHEFGHSIRHSFDGDDDHFNFDVIRFRYARTHEPCDSGHYSTDGSFARNAFAFNEGWGDYWAGNDGCTDRRSSNLPLDYSFEGDVNTALQQLESCISPAWGGTIGRRGMLQVLKQSPGQIHSFDDFRIRMGEIFPDVICNASTRKVVLSYLSKRLSVPANREWVSTGIDVPKDKPLLVTASGLWSNTGPPAVGAAGFPGIQNPAALMPTADFASLVGRVRDGNANMETFGIGSGAVVEPAIGGTLQLSINDVPGSFGDNQGAQAAVVAYPQPQKEIYPILAYVPWTDTGIVLKRGALVTIDATGTWSNVLSGALSPDGYPGYHHPAQIFADADFASLIGRVDGKYFAIGKHRVVSIPATGRLYVGMNDLPGSSNDNNGILTIHVTYPEQYVGPPRDQSAELARRRELLAARLDDLATQRADARAQAAGAVCDVVDQCEAAFARTIAPTEIDAAIALTKLEASRLKKGLSPGAEKSLDKQIDKGTLDVALAKGQQSYRKRLLGVHRKMLKKALTASKNLAATSAGAAAMRDELSIELADLTLMLRDGRELPANLVPTDADLFGETAIPTPASSNHLTLVLNGEGCANGAGYGTVTSVPAGVSCTIAGSGIECSGDFPVGANVSLQATGSDFSAFSGPCAGSACTVAMDGPVTILATFCYAPIVN